MTRWRALIAALGSLALVVGACGPTPPTGGGGQTAAPDETPQQGGRIIEGSFADIKTLQPVLIADNPSNGVAALIYDGLFLLDPKTGEPKPGMATWTVSPDGLTYTWEIGAGASWSDGKPVIAEDFLTIVKAFARSVATVRKGNFSDVEGFAAYSDGSATSISGITIDATNPKKFSVRFTRVFCPALLNVFGWAPLPTHVFGKYTVDDDPTKNIDEAPENTNPPVASGPFKFKEWRQGDQVILERNETYWDGAPLVDEYVFKVVADATVLAAQLKTGEINYGAIEAKDLEDMERQENLNTYTWQALSYTYAGWNLRQEVFQDRRVRQALAYGLDMDAVVQTILFGQGTKMVAHHPPASWAAPEGLEDYAYDTAKAESLLEEAGYTKGGDGIYQKDGRPLAFTLVTNQGNKVRETFVQIAAEQYRRIGVQVTPKLEAFQGIVDKLLGASPEIEGVVIGWALGAEPDPHSIWHSSQIPDPARNLSGFNFVAYDNAELDRALEEARAPSDGDCSIAARKGHYDRFNEILNEDQPYNFGFSALAIWVTPGNMRGYDPGAFGHRWNIQDWWFNTE
ncbi:MAG: ABC transporter substrate-binding protein [Candidatus Limnocylindria bacterium]